MESYITIKKASRFEYEDRKSVFIGQAMPVSTEEEALSFLASVKKQYPDARHHVYAYVLRENSIMRFSDDREPQGTAGMPVLDIIRKNGCTDTVIVVTRYFGGTLLGTGGLVRAYTAAAAGALEAAQIVRYEPYVELELVVSYSDYNKVASILTEAEFYQDDIDFSNDVTVVGAMPKEKFDDFQRKITEITAGRAKIKLIGEKIGF